MATNKEIKLATLLLKERLERLTGKKVILKEAVQRVTIDQINDILTNLPADKVIMLYMIGTLKMNKFGKDEEGNKIPNPYLDKVLKKNIYYGKVNYDYAKEYETKVGEKYVPTGRTLGEKQGAIVTKDGKSRLPLTNVEFGSPEYEINGNPISKEELKPFLPPSSGTPSSGMQMIAPYLDNVKSIVIDNNEYQIIK